MQGLLSNELLSKSSILGSSGGGSIKSIQQIKGSTGGTLATSNVAIPTAVNTSKSIVVITQQMPGGLSPQYLIQAKITSPTNIQLQMGLGSADMQYCLTIIEYSIVKSIQKIEYSMFLTPGDIAITAVNLSKSKIVMSYSCNIPQTDANNFFIESSFLNSTTVRLECAGGNNSRSIHLQIIEEV